MNVSHTSKKTLLTGVISSLLALLIGITATGVASATPTETQKNTTITQKEIDSLLTEINLLANSSQVQPVTAQYTVTQDGIPASWWEPGCLTWRNPDGSCAGHRIWDATKCAASIASLAAGVGFPALRAAQLIRKAGSAKKAAQLIHAYLRGDRSMKKGLLALLADISGVSTIQENCG
jgi:hypothetical protein